MKDQLKTTKRVQKIADSIEGEGKELLINIRKKVFQSLDFKNYNEKTKEHEKSIRWKRSANEILGQGYVYEGKACTDIIIAFLGLAKAKGLEGKFVKVYNQKYVHSMAEVKIKESWYYYDIASYNSRPKKGKFTKKEEKEGWRLWKKGKDAWSIGLKNYNDINKISNNPM